MISTPLESTKAPAAVMGDNVSDLDEELDLTSNHLHTLDEIEIKPNLKVLDLTSNRLQHLEPKVLALEHLTKLCLRQNLVSSTSEVEALSSAPTLRYLELRDNQFNAAPCLSAFTSLTYLELSYNEIRSMDPLVHLHAPALEELYVANNKIGVVEGISQLTCLQILELGSNRIKVIEGLETLAHLRELWLGRNRIGEIANMESLGALRRLSLQSNRLTSMLGLSASTALEELYLSHNGIKNIEGIESLTNLKILDIASNQIESLEGLEMLSNLTDLWANDNLIQSMDGVEVALKQSRSTLAVVYLRGNPCALEQQYKLRTMHLLPNLEELDGVPLK